jgi:hypothetical protein
VAAREGELWGGALPEIYKGNKENNYILLNVLNFLLKID